MNAYHWWCEYLRYIVNIVQVFFREFIAPATNIIQYTFFSLDVEHNRKLNPH